MLIRLPPRLRERNGLLPHPQPETMSALQFSLVLTPPVATLALTAWEVIVTVVEVEEEVEEVE